MEDWHICEKHLRITVLCIRELLPCARVRAIYIVRQCNEHVARTETVGITAERSSGVETYSFDGSSEVEVMVELWRNIGMQIKKEDGKAGEQM